jgi:hypothetical protein
MQTTASKSEETRNIRLPQGFRNQPPANDQMAAQLAALEAENRLLRSRNAQLHQQINELWSAMGLDKRPAAK